MRAVYSVLFVACVTPPPPPPEAPVQVAPVRPVTPVVDLPVARAQDPNPPGVTLNVEAVFRDPNPPAEWEQCAGFVNTADDDVSTDFFANCFGADRLRVRVYGPRDQIEEDVFVTEIREREWKHDYLGLKGTTVKSTFWGGLDGGARSLLFSGTDGRDACMQQAARGGLTLGSGHAQKAIIAPGAKGYDEYRVSCGKQNLPDRKIAIYR